MGADDHEVALESARKVVEQAYRVVDMTRPVQESAAPQTRAAGAA